MKHLLVACLLIAAVATLVTLNSIHLKDIFDELITLTEALPDDHGDFDTLSPVLAEHILDKFIASYFSMNLSLPFPEVRETEKTITDMISHIRTGNYEEYLAAKARALLALRILRDYEIPHITNIL